jgi:putative transposase
MCKQELILIQRRKAIKHLAELQRKQLSRLGGKKLYHTIKPFIDQAELKIGRDKLFSILKFYDMLIKHYQTKMEY